MVTARRNGASNSPVKYCLKGTIPATVNNRVASWGIRLAEGWCVWPRSAKKSTKARRTSAAVMGLHG